MSLPLSVLPSMPASNAQVVIASSSSETAAAAAAAAAAIAPSAAAGAQDPDSTKAKKKKGTSILPGLPQCIIRKFGSEDQARVSAYPQHMLCVLLNMSMSGTVDADDPTAS